MVKLAKWAEQVRQSGPFVCIWRKKYTATARRECQGLTYNDVNVQYNKQKDGEPNLIQTIINNVISGMKVT